MRRISSISLVVCTVALAAAAWAGETHKDSMAKPSAQQMAAMKEAMSKCSICKPLVAHLDAIGPISTEVVKLDNGIVIEHSAAPAGAAEFHKACDEMHQAGAQAMKFTDEQAKSQLCEMCQGIRGSIIAGAMMSAGKTKTGEMMVLTSTNPAVQGQLSMLGDKCAMMSGTQQATR